MNKYLHNKKIRGGIIILVAIMMSTFLLGFVALAVDIGHVYAVRKQMQNAADGCALFGAGYILPPNASGGPNFALAQTNAQLYISNYKVDGVTLSNCTVTTGYWDLTQTKPGVRTVTPPDFVGPNDAGAVKVTITKSSGANGGPMPFYFARIFGIQSTNVTVTAVAVMGSPASVPANGIFPLAITQTALNLLWDPITQQPIGGSNPITVTFDQSSLGWTSFNANVNDVPTITSLITNGNPVPYNIGDLIWIQSGVKATIYKDVPTGVDILIAVVTTTATTGQQAIKGFAGFHVDSANQGTKTITGHLSPTIKVTTGSIQGLSYGVYTPPRLVN
jgi:hypothetical protein